MRNERGQIIGGADVRVVWHGSSTITGEDLYWICEGDAYDSIHHLLERPIRKTIPGACMSGCVEADHDFDPDEPADMHIWAHDAAERPPAADCEYLRCGNVYVSFPQ